jgi:hypothetical protein
VTVFGPEDEDTLRNVTPTFRIVTEGFDEAERPLTVRLIVATGSLSGARLVDTMVAGDSATIVLPRPLPELARVVWRASARTADGIEVTSEPGGPLVVAPWLRLVFPNVPGGITLETRRPRFIWTSAGVNAPPGPWVYTFELTATGGSVPPVRVSGLLDTAFVPGFDLESSTSYRWAVTARLATDDSTRVASRASFVILDPSQPQSTILFQNFPNPFPSATSPTTCIWFDLRDPALVRLEITDLRGVLVRTLVPSATVSDALPAGRFGRAVGSSQDSGCDPRFSWDGVADDGRVVPPGIYLARLVVGGRATTRKILFRGR